MIITCYQSEHIAISILGHAVPGGLWGPGAGRPGGRARPLEQRRLLALGGRQADNSNSTYNLVKCVFCLLNLVKYVIFILH